MFDLDAYLERIGLSGRPKLAEVHRSHVAAIPFENLDPHQGIPVSLEEAGLAEKLVSGRRGGYCFEQNLLFAAALEALGAEVEPMLARVRLGAPSDSRRPRSHLLLRVRNADGLWHADVGFGAGTLLEPIPFGPGGSYEQSGWGYRVVPDEAELVLQTRHAGQWMDLYGFVPEPVPRVDIETSNWFTCTHPRSPFVTGLIISSQDPDGTRHSLSDWSGLALTKQTPGNLDTIEVAREEIPRLLETRFELPGFGLNAEGRVVRMDEP